MRVTKHDQTLFLLVCVHAANMQLIRRCKINEFESPDNYNPLKYKPTTYMTLIINLNLFQLRTRPPSSNAEIRPGQPQNRVSNYPIRNRHRY